MNKRNLMIIALALLLGGIGYSCNDGYSEVEQEVSPADYAAPSNDGNAEGDPDGGG